VSKNHGYSSLETKFNKIIINKTNKNDVINNIGPPSSISDFDNNKWFYIERKKTNQSLLKLGLKKIDKNNIIEVNFNNMGIVNNKKLLNLNDMNDVNYVKNITEKNYQKGNFMYGVLSSFREKINAPARKRSKK
tara:strand:+ start:200 stop:601 length:402 start_codon:yes stop_codon:yes gene_type:complete